MAIKARILSAALAMALLTLACNMPGSVITTPTASPGVETAAAQTLEAFGALTPSPGATAPPTNTPAPGVTNPPPATATQPANPPTATPQPCDQAQFIQDVTIADGTDMAPGQGFTKTWRLRNTGTCTWTSGYALVFTGGDSLGAPASVNLPGSVSPGQTVDLSVEMKAPTAAGRYQSNWKLRGLNGQQFGVMNNEPFFAIIDVVVPTGTVSPTPTITLTAPASSGVILDLTGNVCKAEWRTLAGVLACPGTSADSKGYVMRLESPRLETGATETSPVLLTVPQQVENGAITGRFPALAVQSGYHFQATLACLNGQTNCSVLYQLNFSINNGDPTNLGQWTQTYDGSIQGVDVDLSPLAGQQIQIILVVLANGSADQDQAAWINPRIVRQAAYP